jgi:hypothetical protein
MKSLFNQSILQLSLTCQPTVSQIACHFSLKSSSNFQQFPFLLFQFNQDLYPSSAGVPLAASTSTSTSSHSPCSPALLPPALSSSTNLAHSSAHTPSSIPLVGSLGQRHVAKEEDLTVPRTETEGNRRRLHVATTQRLICIRQPSASHVKL